MTIQEKLDFFLQLVQCNHNLSLHSFPPEYVLSHSPLPQDAASGDNLDTLILLNLEEPLRRHAEAGKRTPLFIADRLGLIWIAAFEYLEEALQCIHVLGPAFSAKNSYQVLKKELNQHNLSVKIRARVFRNFDDIPIIPSNQLYQYASMLHYCVTGERLTANDLYYAGKSEESPSSAEVNLIMEEHRGIWMAEQEFMSMLREGNPGYLQALARAHSLSDGPRYDIGDSLRKAKSTSIVLLTLCSRAAIEGGVNPSVAYTLNDYYMQKIEDSKNIAEITNLCSTFTADYVSRVQQEKEQHSISRQIKNACDYISMHIREKLSITQLAGQAGYTEYYFSHKFKKETGCSVADYIKQEKIRQAKLLLSSTKMSIQEISDELSFGSRSYFSSSFQKEAGLSPSEYREQNGKL